MSLQLAGYELKQLESRITSQELKFMPRKGLGRFPFRNE